jgi:hypothetical protein
MMHDITRLTCDTGTLASGRKKRWSPVPLLEVFYSGNDQRYVFQINLVQNYPYEFVTACTIAPLLPWSKPSNVFTSSFVSSKSYTSAFSMILDGVLLFGGGTQSFCKQYRTGTCATVLLCAFATALSVGSLAFGFRTTVRGNRLRR